MTPSAFSRRIRKRCTQPIEWLEPRTYFSISFPSAEGLAGLNSANGVAVADLNGDGHPDVVAVGNGGNGTPEVAVYINKGDGTFNSPILLYPPGASVSGVAIGDFNGDHVPDIATLDTQDSAITVLLGAPANLTGAEQPSFLSPITTTFGSAGSGAPAGGIWTAHFGGGSDNLIVDDPNDARAFVLLSTSQGHFTTPSPILGPGGVNVIPRLVADFNGDGISDILYTDSNGIEVQYGTTSAGFSTTVHTSALNIPGTIESMAVGALSSGGKPDLVIATDTPSNSGNNNAPYDLSVFRNTGAGTFAASVNYAPTIDPASIALGDFDANGTLDVAVADSSGNLNIFSGTGSGTLMAPKALTNATGLINQVTTADLNSDGKADLIYSGESGNLNIANDPVIVQLEAASNSGGGGGGGAGGGGGGGSPSLSGTVTTTTLPTSVIAGSTASAQASVEVVNTGSATETGSTTVAVYASSDGSIDANAILLGSVTRNLNLKAGGEADVAVAIKSLPASLDGSYELLTKVTASSGNITDSSSGPTLTAAAPFIAFSDTILRTTLPPSNVSGQTSKASVQLKIVNDGNTASTGNSTISFYASPDTTAADGTLIRSVSEKIVVKPSASRVITIPLLNLPVVKNGSYDLVAQVTDPKGGVSTSVASGTYAFAAPFLALTPSTPVVTVAKDGSATVSFTVTNDGNTPSSGSSTVTIYASSDGTITNATAAFTATENLPLAPGKSKSVHLKLTAAQVTTLQAAVAAILQVTDPLGGSQTVALSI